jgi:hypothetical protein
LDLRIERNGWTCTGGIPGSGEPAPRTQVRARFENQYSPAESPFTVDEFHRQKMPEP